MCYLLEVQAGQEIPEIKEYIVLISYLYAQLCLPNLSAMSYKICRNINIQRNVKYRPVEKHGTFFLYKRVFMRLFQQHLQILAEEEKE